MTDNSPSTAQTPSVQPEREVCGLVMPISAVQPYPADHWANVKEIIGTSVEVAGYTPNLVSDGNTSSLIHGRIVQNLFNYPLVICDVSNKSPNVMFELGLRLSFNKPTIIIKDDLTDYSFDTAPIEHIPYPHDLRFGQIVAFQKILAKKLRDTAEAVRQKKYTNFLDHFQVISLAKIDRKEVDKSESFVEKFEAVTADIEIVKRFLKQLLDTQSGMSGSGIAGYVPINAFWPSLHENQAYGSGHVWAPTSNPLEVPTFEIPTEASLSAIKQPLSEYKPGALATQDVPNCNTSNPDQKKP